MAYIPMMPPLCPQCHRIAHKITICRNCGYQYQSSLSFGDVLILIGLFLVVTWFAVTMMNWLGQSDLYERKKSLVEVLKGQWEYIKSLKIY
jgi:hypothetical protein